MAKAEPRSNQQELLHAVQSTDSLQGLLLLESEAVFKSFQNSLSYVVCCEKNLEMLKKEITDGQKGNIKVVLEDIKKKQMDMKENVLKVKELSQERKRELMAVQKARTQQEQEGPSPRQEDQAVEAERVEEGHGAEDLEESQTAGQTAEVAGSRQKQALCYVEQLMEEVDLELEIHSHQRETLQQQGAVAGPPETAEQLLEEMRQELRKLKLHICREANYISFLIYMWPDLDPDSKDAEEFYI